MRRERGAKIQISVEEKVQSGFPVELIKRLSGATDRAYHVSLSDVYRGGAECSTLDSVSGSCIGDINGSVTILRLEQLTEVKILEME